jgi:hypothetical protein
MSQRIEAGLDPYVETPTPAWLRFEIIMARFAEFWLKPRREFLSVTAKKPDSDS